MASSKREREAARRRYAKYQAARAARDKARRRRQVIGVLIVGALVLTLGVTATIAVDQQNRQREAQRAQELAAEYSATPEPTDSQSIDTESADGETSDAEPSDAEPTGTAPDPALAEDRAWTGTITTNRGEIDIELDGTVAPQAVANFVTLAGDGFFDMTSCHRLVTSGIYILQCGDPEGTGMGGPGYRWGPVENAPADNVYPAGTIAMARVGGDAFSQGSQFFLVYEDSPIPSDTAGGYTVFGQITSGLDVVKAIADEGNGADGTAPASDVIIEGVQVQ